jgi:hypothetical protein
VTYSLSVISTGDSRGVGITAMPPKVEEGRNLSDSYGVK